MPAQESATGEIQRMNPPFCTTPQKAWIEERSPGADGERQGLACVSGVHFFLSAAGNVPNIKKKSHALSLLEVSVRSRWVGIS